MLNKSGLHLNENLFCFRMAKCHETICLDRRTTTIEVFLKRKVVTKNLCFDFSTVNTDGPSNSNIERNTEKSFLCINESAKAYRLQNPRNVIIDYLNVNSFREKIIAVE